MRFPRLPGACLKGLFVTSTCPEQHLQFAVIAHTSAHLPYPGDWCGVRSTLYSSDCNDIDRHALPRGAQKPGLQRPERHVKYKTNEEALLFNALVAFASSESSRAAKAVLPKESPTASARCSIPFRQCDLAFSICFEADASSFVAPVRLVAGGLSHGRV